MSLANPSWLLGALGVAVALVLLWRASDSRRRAALERFAALQLLPDLTADVSLRRRGVKRRLLLGAVALGGLALAGPQYGFTWEETQRRGIDVLIAVDTSRSMLAQDVAPNRLERSKLAIIDLIEKLGGDRVGLIAFAGSAFLQCPLTLDHGAFLEALQALQPGVIPAPGSDLASALRTAEEALQSEKRNVKLLILFSDGEDLGGGAIEAARQAAEQGIRVFTVGVGSDTGELIPLPGANGGTEFLKGPDGQFVKSRLDADTLRQVAEITGGFYEPLGRRGEAVAAIYDRALAPLPKEELASRMRRVPLDRYQWPLALALLCLTIELVLGERRGRGVRPAAGVALAFLALARAAGATSPQEAARLYDAGQYEEALAAYRAATAGGDADPSLDFNLGAAAYKAGEYADAATAFARALRTDDPKLQEQGFYNLGNAQFRVGQQTLQSDPQQTMQAWQQSLDAYESALEVDPADEDARFNRDFVKHALEELQKQQEQQQRQKQDEKNDEQDEQQKDEQQQQQPEQNQDEQQDPQQGDPSGDQSEQQKQEQQAKQDQSSQDQQREDQQKQDQQQAKGGGEQQDKPPEGDGTPEARNEQPPRDPGEQTARAPQRQPGQMSPAEAKELLDSLKDGEATLQELQASQPRPRSDEPERDW